MDIKINGKTANVFDLLEVGFNNRRNQYKRIPRKLKKKMSKSQKAIALWTSKQ